jgi:hypothetical protein
MAAQTVTGAPRQVVPSMTAEKENAISSA